MAATDWQPVVQQIRRLFGTAAADGDGQLLGRFVEHRDEAAFAELVRRHGGMVLDVCRSVLRDGHDADDAFQATFLVLVRRASAVRKRDSIVSWLHGVALRVARKARDRAQRRQACERKAVDMTPTDPPTEDAWRELRPLVHAELSRLPEKYRAPMTLCYLEGKTNEEAARELHWPVGTVKGRLSRARDLIRDRLTRRGVALSAATAAVVSLDQQTLAAVSPPLIASTLKAAALVAAGNHAAGLSAPVAALVEGVLRDMFLHQLKVPALLFIAAVIGIGTALFAYRNASAQAPPPAPAAGPAAPANPAAAARKFDSTLPMFVFQRTGRVAKRIGVTPSPNKQGVIIPAGADWYVTPMMAGGAVPPRPGGFGAAGGGAGFAGGIQGGVGIGGGANIGGGGANVGFGGGGFGGFGGGGIGGFGGGGFGGGGGIQMAALGDKELTSFINEVNLKSIPGIALENRPFSDEQLAQLQKVKNLQTLILLRTTVTDEGLKHLAGIPGLRTLMLEGDSITDDGLHNLEGVRGLHTLELGGNKITSNAVKRLPHFEGLKVLRFCWTDLDDDGLKHLAAREDLASQTGLEELEIVHGGVTDAGLVHLKELHNLSRLGLYLLGITDDGLKEVAQLPQLRQLAVDCCTDGVGVAVSGPARAGGFGAGGFMGAGFGGRIAGVMQANNQLHIVTPAGPVPVPTGRVTNAGVKYLKERKELTALALASDYITDAGLADVGALTALKRLRLQSSEITDRGMANLKGLTQLEVLDLTGTATTPACAASLRLLPRLNSLTVSFQCGDPEVNLFKRALPRARVQRNDILSSSFGGGMIGGFGGGLP